MARPLRIERVGGRFHATARGNERKDIFRDDTDRYHFLSLVSGRATCSTKTVVGAPGP